VEKRMGWGTRVWTHPNDAFPTMNRIHQQGQVIACFLRISFAWHVILRFSSPKIRNVSLDSK
jgi:hypothetical protein